jgi:hypothetical protein
VRVCEGIFLLLLLPLPTRASHPIFLRLGYASRMSRPIGPEALSSVQGMDPMIGHGAKKQGCKAKIHPQRLKKIFTPKQLDHDYSVNPSTPAAVSTYKSMHRSISSTDDVLIFSTPKRLGGSPLPSALLDSIHNRRNRSCSGISALSYLMPTSFYSSRSQYHQTKKMQKNLPPTLKRCAHKFDAKCSYSAWERQKVSTSRIPMFTHFRSVKVLGRHSAFPESDHTGKMNIVQTESSESCFLPLVVSPGNKFIPIGCEVDDHQSFASNDYDICKQEIDEGNDWPGSVKDEDRESQEQSHSAVILPTDSPMMDTTCDRYSQSTDLHQKLSRISLDDASSQNSTKSLQTDGLQEEHESVRDKYCIPLEHGDNDNWFPNIKEEFLKVAHLFSNCGATYTSYETKL